MAIAPAGGGRRTTDEVEGVLAAVRDGLSYGNGDAVIALIEKIARREGIEIPQSIVTAKPRETVVVMLSKDELFVQGERVASIAEVRAAIPAAAGGRRGA